MTEAVQYVWTEIEKGGREINNQNETVSSNVWKKPNNADTRWTWQKEQNGKNESASYIIC